MGDHQKTAVVDFDNTLSGYDKWRGPKVFGPIIPYAKDALEELREWGWRIVVFTTRGDVDSVVRWLLDHGFGPCEVNETAHNPPGCSTKKPIGEVYFDDRDAHCMGKMPYNWHRAMARVRRRYQPRLDTYIDDASAWAHWWVRYFVAPGVRRRFARGLPLQLDLIHLRAEGKGELASQIERESFADSQGMRDWLG